MALDRLICWESQRHIYSGALPYLIAALASNLLSLVTLDRVDFNRRYIDGKLKLYLNDCNKDAPLRAS